jgi:hypothetical protein
MSNVFCTQNVYTLYIMYVSNRFKKKKKRKKKENHTLCVHFTCKKHFSLSLSLSLSLSIYIYIKTYELSRVYTNSYRLIIESNFVFTNGSFNNQFEHESSLVELIPSKLTSSSARLHT